MKSIKQIINELKSQHEMLGGAQFSAAGELLKLLGKHDCDREGRSHTAGHAKRSSKYLGLLYDEMIGDEHFGKQLSKIDRTELVLAGKLHDVGKLLIPNKIISGNNKLTSTELTIMGTHGLLGGNIIYTIMEDKLLESSMSESEKSSFRMAQDIAYSHHARWDGKGYPLLNGENIPLLGRMMAIPDVYDALVSERSYKGAASHEEASELIKRAAGSRFDPRITEIFEKCKQKFGILRDIFEKECKQALPTEQDVSK